MLKFGLSASSLGSPHFINLHLLSKNNTLFLLTHAQLCASYIYVGLHKIYLNNNLNKYILGNYNFISIINLYVVLSVVKRNLLLIIKILVNNYLSLFIIHEDFAILPYFAESFKNIDIDYFFGFWWGGLLKNFKKIKFHKPFRYKNYNFKYNRFPGFVFYINPSELRNNFTIKAVADELKSSFLLNLLIFNTNASAATINNWILSNTISFKSSFFWLKLFEFLGIKNLLIRKKKFFITINKFLKMAHNEKTI